MFRNSAACFKTIHAASKSSYSIILLLWNRTQCIVQHFCNPAIPREISSSISVNLFRVLWCCYMSCVCDTQRGMIEKLNVVTCIIKASVYFVLIYQISSKLTFVITVARCKWPVTNFKDNYVSFIHEICFQPIGTILLRLLW